MKGPAKGIWVDGEFIPSITAASKKTGISYEYLAKTVRGMIEGQHGAIVIKGHLISSAKPTAKELEEFQKSGGQKKKMPYAPRKPGPLLGLPHDGEPVRLGALELIQAQAKIINDLERRIIALEGEKFMLLEKNQARLHSRYVVLKNEISVIREKIADMGGAA